MSYVQDRWCFSQKEGRGGDRNGQERHFSHAEKSYHSRDLERETLNPVGGTGLLMHELNHFRWNIIGLTEMHRIGTQELVVSWCKIINLGGEWKHTAGVALVLSSLVQKHMLGYRPINDQIILARF